MKAEKCNRQKRSRKAGITLIEISLSVFITVFLAGVIYRLFDRYVNQSNNDGKASQYYLDLGNFTEALSNDLAMARAVQPIPDGVSLLINPDGKPASITYSLRGDVITREFRGAEKTFRIANPNPKMKDNPLIFRIEGGEP